MYVLSYWIVLSFRVWYTNSRHSYLFFFIFCDILNFLSHLFLSLFFSLKTHPKDAKARLYLARFLKIPSSIHETTSSPPYSRVVLTDGLKMFTSMTQRGPASHWVDTESNFLDVLEILVVTDGLLPLQFSIASPFKLSPGLTTDYWVEPMTSITRVKHLPSEQCIDAWPGGHHWGRSLWPCAPQWRVLVWD